MWGNMTPCDGLWVPWFIVLMVVSHMVWLIFYLFNSKNERGCRLCNRWAAHLPQLLHERAQPLGLRLGVGRYGSTDGHLRLQLQQTAHVVGLLAGWLLQQRLLCGLAILCHLTLVTISLTKSLGRQSDAVVSVFAGELLLILLYIDTFGHQQQSCRPAGVPSFFFFPTGGWRFSDR